MKNVSRPSNPPDELAQNVSKKNPRRTNYSSIFSEKVQNLTVFSIIYMIRIRFFGPGELIQKYFRRARYAFSSNMSSWVSVPSSTWTPHTRSWHRGAMCLGRSTAASTQRVRRPVIGSYTACRIDFVFPRRRLTHLCRKPRVLARGCIHAFEATRLGKTAVVIVVSDRTGFSIRQASSTSQTRQSRHLPFRGVQPPSWPRRHRLPLDEPTRSRVLLSALHLTLSFST